MASLNKSQAAPQQQLTQAQRENSLRTAITDWKAGKAHQGETFLSFVTAWAPYLPLYQIKSIYNSMNARYKESDQQVYAAYQQGGGK